MSEWGYVALAYVVGYGAIAGFATLTAYRIKVARDRLGVG